MKPFVDIHTHGPLKGSVGLRSYRLGIERPTEESGVYSLGIHPWDVCRVENTQQLLADLHAAGCVAIGEIGLDKVCGADFARQIEVFEQQLIIASNRNLPIVIHCVKAQQEVVDILAPYSTPFIIFHGFIGSIQQAEQLWQNGYYLSFGFGALKSPKTQEALRRCPAEYLFLESDTIEESIIVLYDKVSALRGVGVEELRESIYNNYNRIFK